MTQPLYDDTQATELYSLPQQQHGQQPGRMHAMTGGQPAAGQQGQPGQSGQQLGGLDASSSVSGGGQNPVAAAIGASSWTHDDVAVALSALSIIAWVATTYYVATQT